MATVPIIHLGDIGDAHAGLSEAAPVLGEPEHVGGLGPLGGVRVLLRALRDAAVLQERISNGLI